jgi:regulator of sigma D
MKQSTATDTETLKENLNSAAEMAKTFAENSTKQFESTLNAGKAIFDTITKQYIGKNHQPAGNHAEFIKDGIENSIHATSQWFKESSKIMTELYDKQVRFLLNSYSDFIESANESINKVKDPKFGSNTFHSSLELFLKNLEDSATITKTMFSNIVDRLNTETDQGYIKEISDLMQETYSKQTEQLIEFNKNLLSAENLQNTINLNKEISSKLQNDLEKNFEASKKIIQSISDTYTKETSFSAQRGKKMLDEIFAEIDVVTNNNMKFWTKWFEEVYKNNKNTTKTGSKKNA